jgi:hypothetical protein
MRQAQDPLLRDKQTTMAQMTRRIRVVFPLVYLLASSGCSEPASGDKAQAASSAAAVGTVGSASAGATAASPPSASTAAGHPSASASAAGLPSARPSATALVTPSVGIPSASATAGGIPSAGIPSTGIPSASATTAGIPSASASTASHPSTSATSSGPGPSSGSVFHIFLLMGQSNMAGVADKEASDQNTDDRLKVWGGCNQPAGQWNTANPPLNDCPGEKGWNLSTSVDPGIWFGKTLLEKLPAGDTIGLVGTAESGESITTFIAGGSHHQMILRKISEVKSAENGRFEGIIFHQGESDNGQNSWPDKVVQLYTEVKAAFGVDYDVPFILGELPNGGCCSGHNTQVHAAAMKLPKGYFVSQDGTNVLDEYHFDHASVLIMGKRYGASMIEALGW